MTSSTEIELLVLGSGTSTGIPMLACHCRTCRSADPRDRRLRASALIRWDDCALIIDTGPEFRLQMLRADCHRLDAVLLTHDHADHVAGLDDIRQLTFHMTEPMPVYGSPDTLRWIRRRFGYIWEAVQEGGGLPRIALQPVDRPFTVHGQRIVPIPVKHGILDIYGYRIGDLAYVSDVSHIPAPSMDLLVDLDLLVIDAVRYRRHATHMHLAAALAVIERLRPRRAILTHLNHDYLHAELAANLPDGVEPAYDGLTVRSRPR